MIGRLSAGQHHGFALGSLWGEAEVEVDDDVAVRRAALLGECARALGVGGTGRLELGRLWGMLGSGTVLSLEGPNGQLCLRGGICSQSTATNQGRLRRQTARGRRPTRMSAFLSFTMILTAGV